MKLLALDTSSLACTVALSADGRVASRHETEARQHTALLVPMIRAVSEETGVALQGLDGVVLGNGPGSFIGMRIAASVAQGMAFAARRPLLPVSSMAALAAAAVETGDRDYVAVAQDAHMGQIYFGLYRASDGFVEPLCAERIAEPRVLGELESLPPGSCATAGVGWAMYPELASANPAVTGAQAQLLYPDARYLLEPGRRALAAGEGILPEALEPAYLRDQVASVPAPKTP